LSIKEVAELYRRVLTEVSKAVISKDSVKEALVLALLAGGHVLVEGPPGTAKTKLARSFAEAIGGDFKRIQFTPDMMPADITGFFGYSVLGDPKLIEGPIFANIILADELNRTTPRTQSALLEAMQESQVTIEKKTYALKKPFMVMATQVQAGGEGTYLLTDVQVDRFMLRVWSAHPTKEEERQIVGDIDRIDEPNIQPVTSLEEILALQRFVKGVHVSPQIIDYTVSLVDLVRTDPDVLLGPSTRATIAIFKCARVLALLDERDFVIPDDIKHLAPLAMEHRIRIKPEGEMDNVTPEMILKRALERIPVPRQAE
jgi:MoxR-like ATPase